MFLLSSLLTLLTNFSPLTHFPYPSILSHPFSVLLSPFHSFLLFFLTSLLLSTPLTSHSFPLSFLLSHSLSLPFLLSLISTILPSLTFSIHLSLFSLSLISTFPPSLTSSLHPSLSSHSFPLSFLPLLLISVLLSPPQSLSFLPSRPLSSLTFHSFPLSSLPSLFSLSPSITSTLLSSLTSSLSPSLSPTLTSPSLPHSPSKSCLSVLFPNLVMVSCAVSVMALVRSDIFTRCSPNYGRLSHKLR